MAAKEKEVTNHLSRYEHADNVRVWVCVEPQVRLTPIHT